MTSTFAAGEAATFCVSLLPSTGLFIASFVFCHTRSRRKPKKNPVLYDASLPRTPSFFESNASSKKPSDAESKAQLESNGRIDSEAPETSEKKELQEGIAKDSMEEFLSMKVRAANKSAEKKPESEIDGLKAETQKNDKEQKEEKSAKKSPIRHKQAKLRKRSETSKKPEEELSEKAFKKVWNPKTMPETEHDEPKRVEGIDDLKPTLFTLTKKELNIAHEKKCDNKDYPTLNGVLNDWSSKKGVQKKKKEVKPDKEDKKEDVKPKKEGKKNDRKQEKEKKKSRKTKKKKKGKKRKKDSKHKEFSAKGAESKKKRPSRSSKTFRKKKSHGRLDEAEKELKELKPKNVPRNLNEKLMADDQKCAKNDVKSDRASLKGSKMDAPKQKEKVGEKFPSESLKLNLESLRTFEVEALKSLKKTVGRKVVVESETELKPKSMPRTLKEELIANGLKRQKDEYPTMDDVKSDWEDSACSQEELDDKEMLTI